MLNFNEPCSFKILGTNPSRMMTMKITEYLYFYKAPVAKNTALNSSNTIVIFDGKTQIMIDPGLNIRKKWKRLIREMSRDGLDLKKTTEIWLTHGHPDHTGLVNKVVRKTKAKVRCHPLIKEILEDKNPTLAFNAKQKEAAGKLYKLNFFLRGLQANFLRETLILLKVLRLKKTKIDEAFRDEEEIITDHLKIYVLYLPGHCPNEIGFWIPRKKTLIIGDLIHPLNNGLGGRSCLPVLNTFVSDLDDAQKTIEKLQKIRGGHFLFFQGIFLPKILLPTHGEPVEGRENIEKLLDNLAARIKIIRETGQITVQEYPNASVYELVDILAKRLAKQIPENLITPTLKYEMRFAAFAALKSLEVIK